jgi:hypothetical protein
MNRNFAHLLICMTLSLMLVASGVKASAARLSMALEGEATTELVICADGQAKTVFLNAKGEPVTPDSKKRCANCPDCRHATAITQHFCTAVEAVMRSISVPAPVLPVSIVATYAEMHPQPRAPPKGP